MYATVAELVAAIHPVLRDYARLAKLDLPHGAEDAQLSAVQAKLGADLPPSYREFLRVQNGWPKFGKVRIAGTLEWLLAHGEFASECAKRKAAYFKARNVNGEDPAAVAAYEPKPGEIVPWRHWVFALGPDGELWFFDTAHRADSGELPVAQYRPADGICGGWPTFQAWLEATLAARH